MMINGYPIGLFIIFFGIAAIIGALICEAVRKVYGKPSVKISWILIAVAFIAVFGGLAINIIILK